jgi:hypothetical protein
MQMKGMRAAKSAGSQLDHDAKGRDVGAAPGFAINKARQQVSQAKQQQCRTWQTAYRRLGNDGWAGLVHAG